MNSKILTPEEVHAVLQKAHFIVAELYGNIPLLSMDTALSIGEAIGILGRARALVARDIDDVRRIKAENPLHPVSENLSQMEANIRGINNRRDLFAKREEPDV
jgi:hypothetical protein